MTNTNFIKLEDVRLSYPHLFKPIVWEGKIDPKTGKPAEPKFEATFILDPVAHKKELEILNAKIDELIQKKGVKRTQIKAEHLCLKDGNLSGKEEYEDKFTIKTSSYNRVPILAKDAVTPIAEDDGVIYGGCIVSAYIKLGYYDQKGAKGINAKLLSVQFRKDGESFGDRFDVQGAFQPVTDNDTVEDMF